MKESSAAKGILTNNPQKPASLYGFEIVERVPIEIPATATNGAYLNTKRDRLGHLLSVVDETSWLQPAVLCQG